MVILLKVNPKKSHRDKQTLTNIEDEHKNKIIQNTKIVSFTSSIGCTTKYSIWTYVHF